MIERLVGFDTTSHLSNLELVGFVEGWLTSNGIRFTRLPDAAGQEAALVASIGPVDRHGLVLSGHTDTVPVAGQAWSSYPFTLRDGGDRVFGRGACDMKGFVGVVLARLPALMARPLARPIHVCLSYDEEVGCRGADDAIAALAGLPCPPMGAIVGEPTGMAPVVAHKGKLALRCIVTGREGHSSQPHRAVNALEIGAELVVFLRRLAERLCREGGGEGFDPAWTTVHAGVFGAGTALNVVPGRATFDFEIRHLPRHDPDRLVAEVQDFAEATLVPGMRAVDPAAGFSWETLIRYPGLAEEPDSAVAALVRGLVKDAPAKRVSFGTEAGLFQRAGIPALVIGPGDIAQAHRPDEYVSKRQLVRCEQFLDRLADQLCR